MRLTRKAYGAHPKHAETSHGTCPIAGAICVEMECSALFIVGTLRRVWTGAIVAIDGDTRAAASGKHQPRGDLVRQAIDREMEIALDAAAQLASTSHSASRGDSLSQNGRRAAAVSYLRFAHAQAGPESPSSVDEASPFRTGGHGRRTGCQVVLALVRAARIARPRRSTPVRIPASSTEAKFRRRVRFPPFPSG